MPKRSCAAACCLRGAAGSHASQPENEDAALSRLGPGPNFAFVSLHDLINNGQTEAGTTFKLGLEGLEDLLDGLRIHARAGISKIDLPVISCRFKRDTKGSAIAHGADSVLTEIPENLFDLVAVGQRPGFSHRIMSFDANACLFRPQAIFEKGKRVLQQRQKIDF